MKKITLFSLFILLAVLVSAQSARRQEPPQRLQAETNVLSYNIRLDLASDSVNRWDNRKERVVQTILDNEADIVGLQEVIHHQLVYIAESLPNYDWMGVGRGDGMEKGEYSPIFYNKNKFTEVGSGYFWLSETPMEAGSKGWDAALPRIATWAKLQDNRTKRTVFVLNTHFDHMGQQARTESARLILEKINAYTKKELFPVIVTGDFNATPESDVIKSITDVRNPFHLIDTRFISPKKLGVDWSFHNFGRLEMNKRPLIDYVFVQNNVSVLEYEVIDDTGGNGYTSDHCPVLVKVLF